MTKIHATRIMLYDIKWRTISQVSPGGIEAICSQTLQYFFPTVRGIRKFLDVQITPFSFLDLRRGNVVVITVHERCSNKTHSFGLEITTHRGIRPGNTISV